MIDAGFWKDRRVLLTGNTGFKGSWLSFWLEKMGAEVTGFALPPPTHPSLFFLADIQRGQKWVEGDVRDGEKILATMKESRPEIVFHLAAQPLVKAGYQDPVGTYATNVMGTVNVLEAVRQVDTIRSVVNVTTDKCYENQEWVWGYREEDALGGFDPYSSSKGCSELVTAAYRRSFFNSESYKITHSVALATARAGNVIGGGDFANDRLIPDILRAIEAGERVQIRNPRATRPWQHVLEPLSAYLTLAQVLYENGPSFAEAWNFGPHDRDVKTVEWIAKTLCDLVPGSKRYEANEGTVYHEAGFLKLDISKATSRLNWSPKWNLEIALRKILEWHSSVPQKGSVRETMEKQIQEYESA